MAVEKEKSNPFFWRQQYQWVWCGMVWCCVSGFGNLSTNIGNRDTWALWMTGFDCCFSIFFPARILETHQYTYGHYITNSIGRNFDESLLIRAISLTAPYLFNHLIVVDRKWENQEIRVKIRHIQNALLSMVYIALDAAAAVGANCLKWLLTNIYLIGFLFSDYLCFLFENRRNHWYVPFYAIPMPFKYNGIEKQTELASVHDIWS